MTDSLDGWEVAARLGAAVLAGGILGWERELADKPAGLRTHMMVALGAALPIIAAVHFLALVSAENPLLQIDPLRVVQGIMGGIGFLGAGAIIQSRHAVRGLTTAATIWVSAAVGIACGFGFYLQVATVVGLAMVVLLLFGFVEGRVFDRPEPPEEPPSDPKRPQKTAMGGAGAKG